MAPPATSTSPGGYAAGSSTAAAKPGGKQIPALLGTYLKARVAFAQGVTDFAARECGIELLVSLQDNIVPLLRPLPIDSSASVQQAAALALGCLANFSPAISMRLVDLDVIQHIVFSLDEQSNVRACACARAEATRFLSLLTGR